MAFGDFKYPDVLQQFGLTYLPQTNLFAGVPPLPMTPAVAQTLQLGAPLATLQNTEKARSEWLIGLILLDVWGRYENRIGLYSGQTFVADPDAGLTGLCDFLLCRSPQQVYVTLPAVVIVEAKNESVPGGMGQCIAAMIGAQRANQKAGADADPIYGCVTTGSVWRFCRLSGTQFTLDRAEYTVTDADKLIGIFASILGPIPAAEVAA